MTGCSNFFFRRPGGGSIGGLDSGQNCVHRPPSAPRAHRTFCNHAPPSPPQALLSRPITAQRCGVSEFYVPGDTACRACVTGAVCNGTAALVTAPNHWRLHNATVTFFECGATEPCVGGATVGTCRPGFRGPLCALCADGHAGESCVECGDPLSSQFVIGALGLGYFVIVGVVILKALGKGHDHSASAPMIVFKVAITYLQVCSSSQRQRVLCPLRTAFW